MAPSRVDPNKKNVKSSINQVEEDPFYLDRMARTVNSFPSQATVNYAKRTPQVLYYECLDDGEAQRIPTPDLLFKVNMQERFAAVRATVIKYMLPVGIPKNTFSPYGDSDEESDGPPPSPKKTDATEMKIDKSLQNYIEALPHLEPLHYGFKLQGSNQNGYCICSLANGLTPWRRRHEIVDNYSLCGMKRFQGQSLIQHCEGKGDAYHTATAFYLRTLFKTGMGLTQTAIHHGKNGQSRKTVDANKQISGQYYQPVDSQESNHVNKVNENVENKAGDIGENLAVYDDLEKNDASTSVEQEYQGDFGASDYNIDSDE